MSRGAMGLIALAGGCAVAVAAILTYQAWWTLAFAAGGAAVAIFERRGRSGTRSLAGGIAIGGAVVLVGMGGFFLYGGLSRGGAPWLAASIGCLAFAAILLALVRRRPARVRT